MTVHAAKGLEFPIVFIVGMEDGLFPHSNSLYDDDDLEEERRACYVALTRAEKKLYITSAESRMFNGNIRQQEISRFVEEIPDAYIEKTDGKKNLAQCLIPSRASIKIPPQKSAYKAPTTYRAPQTVKPTEKKSTVDFHVGDQINHKMWGLGSVMTIEGKYITIRFANPEVGSKKFLVKSAPIVRC
jgi:DNA helicase-2/ATP-dependent DNA helicase PcrA